MGRLAYDLAMGKRPAIKKDLLEQVLGTKN